jgi:hypothetical protein
VTGGGRGAVCGDRPLLGPPILVPYARTVVVHTAHIIISTTLVHARQSCVPHFSIALACFACVLAAVPSGLATQQDLNSASRLRLNTADAL